MLGQLVGFPTWNKLSWYTKHLDARRTSPHKGQLPLHLHSSGTFVPGEVSQVGFTCQLSAGADRCKEGAP